MYTKYWLSLLILAAFLFLWLRWPGGETRTVSLPSGNVAATEEGASDVREMAIVSLLPRDAIPAIHNPQFLARTEANEQYADDELVLGFEINGDARAYSIPFLSGHEIVNDVVGGKPIAVTW